VPFLQGESLSAAAPDQPLAFELQLTHEFLDVSSGALTAPGLIKMSGGTYRPG
jgi:hypothetical protein